MAGKKIKSPLPTRRFRELRVTWKTSTIHLDDEIAVINAVFPLIHKHEALRGTGIQDGGLFHENHPARVGVRNPGSGITPTGTTHPVLHGHTADARNPLAEVVNRRGMVGRALPNTGRITAVRPQRTLFRVKLMVPIVRIFEIVQSQPASSRPVWNVVTKKRGRSGAPRICGI